MRDRIWRLLLFSCWLLVGCDRPQGPSKFDAIRQTVIEGRFDAAIPRLKEFQRRHADSPNASRAGLFLGKAYLGRGEFDAAARAFEATIEKYPQSLEAHKSRYKLGMIAVLRRQPERAAAIFSELARARDGPLAPEAQAMSEFLRAE